MSKLACTCGNIIRDQTDSLPYKATLIKNQQEEHFLENVAKEINTLLVAATEGKLEELLNEKYGCTSWRPRANEVCYEIVGSTLLSSSVTAYECQSCGKLWIQK